MGARGGGPEQVEGSTGRAGRGQGGVGWEDVNTSRRRRLATEVPAPREGRKGMEREGGKGKKGKKPAQLFKYIESEGDAD